VRKIELLASRAIETDLTTAVSFSSKLRSSFSSAKLQALRRGLGKIGGSDWTEWRHSAIMIMMIAAQICVERLYVSAGHNFFGHHGQPAGVHRIAQCEKIHCVAGRGIVGDRFFDHKEYYKGQISFFASEVFEDVCRKLDISDQSPGVLRRNVITVGIDLNSLIGEEFNLQGLRFAGVEECHPCYWMDQALAPGAEALLRGRGGLRARIIVGGTLRGKT